MFFLRFCSLNIPTLRLLINPSIYGLVLVTIFILLHLFYSRSTLTLFSVH